MKLRNICRMQAIVVGFGAALLLASSARAQEIENTNWADGPGVVAFAQPATDHTANDFSTAAIHSDAAEAAVAMIQPVATQEEVFARLSPVEEWAVMSVLICMALLGLYALAETRHRNRRVGARTEQMNSRAAL